ncbi:MAG: TlyA family RNA methyltransferase [Promethearchaeia archaeon]
MKESLDLILVERRLVDSRRKAQWLINNGYVLVNGEKIAKPGKQIDNELEIELTKQFPYVSRGGIKLEKALATFKININGKVCADIGASVGGFTDCLIKHGAEKVYAIDSSTNLLHLSLRCKKMEGKVIPMLGIDARELKDLEQNVDLCTIDITMTSLRNILPNVENFTKKEGEIVGLIKPIFEITEDLSVNENNLKKSKDLQKILEKFMEWCCNHGFFPHGLILSPLKGKGGTREFLIHLKFKEKADFDYHKKIQNELAKLP